MLHFANKAFFIQQAIDTKYLINLTAKRMSLAAWALWWNLQKANKHTNIVLTFTHLYLCGGNLRGQTLNLWYRILWKLATGQPYAIHISKQGRAFTSSWAQMHGRNGFALPSAVMTDQQYVDLIWPLADTKNILYDHCQKFSREGIYIPEGRGYSEDIWWNN